MSREYWKDFWLLHGKKSKLEDEQFQVLRTSNKNIIEQDDWLFTLNEIEKLVSNRLGTMLELCAGNGLISRHLSNQFDSIECVDISEDLLETIDVNQYPNIRKNVADVFEIEFEHNSFDVIILYAGLQYFSHSEVTTLVENIYRWLKPNGKVFFGDIPDVAKLWDFYNTEERERVYFDNLKNEIDVIGTWFDKGFLKKLSNYAGFDSFEVINQDERLIYSHFRFDVVLNKGVE
ncbi:class I SAM-dependent methyltransferase [Shewanella halifaxensis]|uniref:class I SAM-dependent methyltransferase n=1 Tax=Shewanella halifaxensis TaxID=271098 RepID=UPI000D59846D|nr:class I SAM-dependent methyltransferase [Shewanella halifaxensis]